MLLTNIFYVEHFMIDIKLKKRVQPPAIFKDIYLRSTAATYSSYSSYSNHS